ncbi:MAG TPA: VWA domain-containing protein [Bryobacteraceae bacterium]|nr:VWA domain-containing protein [Bryobacteraceae bacterium]
MQWRYVILLAGFLCLAGAVAQQQQTGALAPAESNAVIRTETRLVLVDAVVTDKKGDYLRDLTAKDFKVWEDNKEQEIKSFSFEADAASPSNNQKRYLVLFFDNSTMDQGDQVRARQAAAKFIESNAAPNRLIAVVDFGGSVHIAQNFTADAERLKQVVSGVKFSSVSPNAQAPVELASIGMPTLGNAEAEFGARSVMLALRTMAKNLSSVPGRKTLVMLTSGFPLTDENRPEVTAAIDACNKANVAIYPIDVRGLVADAGPALMPTSPLGPHGALTVPHSSDPSSRTVAAGGTAFAGYAALRSVSFGSSFLPQHGGGGGGGGAGGGGGHGGGTGGGSTGGGSTGGGTGGGKGGSGGGTGGGKGGGTGGGTGGGKGGGTGGGGKGGGTGGGTGGRGGAGTGMMPGNPYALNPYNQPRIIVPQFPSTATTNQQVLYMLADGTGGFVIINTNDLLGGMQKIGKEQNEYYVLGYSPTDSPEGSCHTIRVKVEQKSTNIRSRSGYCNVKPVDLLAGNDAEKQMEARAAGSAAGNMTASLQVPFFYTSANTAMVNLALEIPPDSIPFEKVKKGFHATVNVLAIAYRPDNGIAAKFSDVMKLDMENKKALEAFKEQLLHYDNQFEVASGKYALKVVISSGGDNFGKMEVPLVIDPYDGKQLSLSAVALSKDIRPMAGLDAGFDAELLEGRKPLVVQGQQITPAGTNRFKKTDTSIAYVEIYEPLLQGNHPPIVGIQLRVVDRKTGEAKQDTGLMNVANLIHAGSPVVPVGMKLPMNVLTAGMYRAEIKAVDSVGHESAMRSADFEIE